MFELSSRVPKLSLARSATSRRAVCASWSSSWQTTSASQVRRYQSSPVGTPAAASANPDWTWGAASNRLTATYDPAAELEIYYLLDASGRVTYVNSPLVSTIAGVLAAVARALPATATPGALVAATGRWGR